MSLRNIDVIAMDEFAIQKAHRSATVVVEPCTKHVLWIGRGWSRESIRPFFRLLGKDGCKRLEAVAMEMNGAYEAEVKAHCPKARSSTIFFCVVVKYRIEVIDKIPRDEAKLVADDNAALTVIKGSRWLLRNKANITPGGGPRQVVRSFGC